MNFLMLKWSRKSIFYKFLKVFVKVVFTKVVEKKQAYNFSKDTISGKCLYLAIERLNLKIEATKNHTFARAV